MIHNDSTQNLFDLKRHIREIPDFPEPGILFYDISTLIKQPDAWTHVIEELSSILVESKINMVYGIEARGFLVAAAVAHRLNIGMQMIRKKGKLPGETISLTYNLEYGEDALEIQSGSITPKHRIAILDDVLATGGTMQAAIELLSSAQAEIICCATIIELPFLNGKEKIKAEFHSLITYD
jgi:adenine phosphoribosyltransferase